MRTIYKYTAKNDYSGCIELPHHVIRFLKIEHQHGNICLWALVDTEKEPNFNKAFPVGTGFPLDDFFSAPHDLVYIDSIQDGQFVWHYVAYMLSE